ncbi:MAG: DUF6157 family protein [Aggregatilineales bacterium]
MAYINTFIKIAPDSTATEADVPTSNREPTPIHILQYQLLTEKPYHYTHEDLTFEVYVRRQGFSAQELDARHDEIWHDLFQKGHPCMRASSLTKKYGWGAHYDDAGKIAIYPVESDEYQQYADNADDVLFAMRSKRA